MDMIIGAFTGYTWEQVRPWAESIETCGFTGLKVAIVYNADFNVCYQLQLNGFKVIAPGDRLQGKLIYNDGKPFSIWNERFKHAHLFLSEFIEKNRTLEGVDKIQNVVMTDVKDVVFQLDPSDYMRDIFWSDVKLLASSEDISYQNEPWGDDNLRKTFPHLYEALAKQTIYNVGVLAGNAYAMRDLFLILYQMTLGADKFISDQSSYNVLVHSYPMKDSIALSGHDSEWACQLGTTADPTKIAQFEPHLQCISRPRLLDGQIVNFEDRPYCIVHQYDRVPEFRDAILEKVLKHE